MNRTALILTLFIASTACSGQEASPAIATSPVPSTSAPRSTSAGTTAIDLAASAATIVPRAPTTTFPPTPAATTTVPVTHVSTPGAYSGEQLVIHVAFSSEVSDVTSAELESTGLAILNAPDGWNRSGFRFVGDDSSDLRVILAEGPRVDELCLPLETFETVSCQNGSVVALNADRWRRGGGGWDSTVAAYRVYLVNHEVGHLVGLRHPLDRCPTVDAVSAVMEPQTNNLGRCVGNGTPLEWEIEWATNRPAIVGPTPDWDGPRPAWPRS